MIITDVGSEDAFYYVKDELIGHKIFPLNKPMKQTYGEKGYMTGEFIVYDLWGKEEQHLEFFAVKYGNK